MTPRSPHPGPATATGAGAGPRRSGNPCCSGLQTWVCAARLTAVLPPVLVGGRLFVYQMCAITDLLRVGAPRGATHAPTRGCLQAEQCGLVAGSRCILGSAGGGGGSCQAAHARCPAGAPQAGAGRPASCGRPCKF